jgi:hypothetical protein
VFTDPEGKGEVEVIAGKVGVLIVIAKFTGPALPTEFEAVTPLTIDAPAVVGVPLNTPLGKSVKPAGSAVLLQIMGGVPDAVKSKEYGTFTIPEGSGEVVVIVGASGGPGIDCPPTMGNRICPVDEVAKMAISPMVFIGGLFLRQFQFPANENTLYCVLLLATTQIWSPIAPLETNGVFTGL